MQIIFFFYKLEILSRNVHYLGKVVFCIYDTFPETVAVSKQITLNIQPNNPTFMQLEQGVHTVQF